VLDSSTDEKARRSACRTLRFLGSADAAREIVRRFINTDHQCNFEYYLGLIGSPQREFIVKEMETSLHAPEHPISYSFVQLLSSLAYFLKNPAPPPPYPTGDEEKQRLWRADAEARRAAQEEIFKSYLSQLAAAFARKRGAARATCLNTLLGYGARKELAEQFSAELPNLFLSLPSEEQYTWLDYRWKEIANPAMLPVLRQIYGKPTQAPRGIRDLALRRLYELAPDEGRRLILKEIESGMTQIRANVLAILPDERLPELDEVLAAQMEAIDSHLPHGELDIYSALVARYASDAIFPRLREVYAHRVGKLACAIQTPLLAYFLRVDPDYGLHMLEQALTVRETGCFSFQLVELARLYWRPEMEKVVVAHLDDSSTEVMAQAATVLKEYGSASAEQPLWDALERWHERYAGQEEKLRADMKRSGDTAWPAARESALVQALGAGRGWRTDAAKVKRIERLCITKDGRQEAADILRLLNDTVVSITLNYMDDSIEIAYVAQYKLSSFSALKDKLAQFPRGTRFTWNWTNGHDKATEELFSELQQYLTEREMRLER
jgi:hypothetical protein